jgi:three-Cys-motif partner protein
MDGAEFYEDREQTLVKHEILKNYLERFAIIVGSRWDTITYVDCFAGPWKAKSTSLSDTSFAIALAKLRAARDLHARRGRNVKLRCLFLEKDPYAFEELQAFAAEVNDLEVRLINGAFEDSIPEILQYVNDGGKSSFPFLFIDPTGWSGIAIETIKPLIVIKPAEVLVNFMTDFIRRFINSPQEQTQASFTRLFASQAAKSRVQAAPLNEREDVAIAEYCDGLRLVGGYKFACSAIVLHPLKDATHYHLIYATRDAKGLDVFKGSENRAMEIMERARAAADSRHELRRTKQKPLEFAEEETPISRHYEYLRRKYLGRAKSIAQEILNRERRVPYDQIWERVLASPLVRESDVKEWIAEWQASGRLKIEGLKPRTRVPQRGKGHILVWTPQTVP